MTPLEGNTCRYSEEFVKSDGTKVWVSQEQVIKEGETAIEVWHRIADQAQNFIIQRFPSMYENRSASIYKGDEDNLPVFQQASKVEDLDWLVVKESLDKIEYMEDAQLFIEGTEYRMAWEAKKVISQKPNKPTT